MLFNNKPKVSIIISIILLSIGLLLIFKPISLKPNQEKKSINLSSPTIDPSKQKKYDKLNKLTTAVQLNYFTKLLGDPVFINYSEDKLYIENIYVDKDYYVQAITDDNNKVLAFTIVSRNIDFSPTLDYKVIKYTLLKDTIADIRDKSEYSKPEKCSINIPASNPFSYYENYYYGKFGLHSTYRIGHATTGYYDSKNSKIDFKSLMEAERTNAINNTSDCNLISNDVTENMYINAVMVMDIEFDKEKLYPFGPRHQQVFKFKE